MGRIWVLDTETKGTGAEMVPLDMVQQRPAPKPEPAMVRRKRAAPKPQPPEPRAPRRFKVVDVATRAVLAEEVDARETLCVLGDVRSSVDVNVSVWEPKRNRWRLLTLDEQRRLWERRGGAEPR
jgi:hypothetical protein